MSIGGSVSKPFDKTGLYPPFAESIAKMEVEANKLGAYLFDGYRSKEEQLVLYSKGREFISPTGQWVVTNPRLVVTKAAPGSSAHNYGVGSDWAFDDNPTKPGVQWSWDDHYQWSELGKIGKALGFEWAAEWRSFPERPHFQMLYGYKIATLLPVLNSQGLPAVWKMFDDARSKRIV
jgi:peptidoglycan LD-endopeptidase CwlK